MEIMLSITHQNLGAANGRLAPGTVPPAVIDFRSGLLVLIDWDTKEISWTAPADSPAGVCFHGDNMYVASMLGHQITGYRRNMTEMAVAQHPLFSDLHTIRDSPKAFLITSSGIDGYIEIDVRSFGTNDLWLATEDGGYRFLADGRRRVIDPRLNFSYIPAATLQQATHINSATYLGEDKILATLFRQGTLICIDRRSKICQTIVRGMVRPHAIRANPLGGWSLCDTASNAVILLDESFRPSAQISENFAWVQDAIVLPDGRLLILDANHTRIVEWSVDHNKYVNELKYPENWKAFALELVPPGMPIEQQDSSLNPPVPQVAPMPDTPPSWDRPSHEPPMIEHPRHI